MGSDATSFRRFPPGTRFTLFRFISFRFVSLFLRLSFSSFSSLSNRRASVAAHSQPCYARRLPRLCPLAGNVLGTQLRRLIAECRNSCVEVLRSVFSVTLTMDVIERDEGVTKNDRRVAERDYTLLPSQRQESSFGKCHRRQIPSERRF